MYSYSPLYKRNKNFNMNSSKELGPLYSFLEGDQK